jgi:hypothetical protein
MDQLQDRGYVGPGAGASPRQVLLPEAPDAGSANGYDEGEH